MIRIAGVVSVLIGAAVLSAPSATADQNEYLATLQPKYVYLTAQQLLSEGDRLCAAESSGAIAPDRAMMVRNDLNVSAAAAFEIVSAAEMSLC